ncbi:MULTISPECIES: metal-sensitive transcriptional regulator [Francisella]|uniref:Transcriptional regulator n=1 Tax=Francisella opportunistica TaxID=2016517 RepID=A0A345JR21_9GAMM|nr:MULTISPECIES: metal-sensitive transcriptional regulator [Francisella]APC91485.1 hypothetical protein BBG19_0749 [Francisella sp. MA067296]AXH29767.1 transcriptional regulator [Francisella opportunistica]AXH31417.1 transcriptional regulator [Francisella opportunistica]AXH33063.1 transcriptional regulator [Francisella opportunistica]
MSNPCHKKHLGKLNRVAGQVEAIKRMIDDQRYCVDIITQVKAARSALKSIELAILETHIQSCLEESYQLDYQVSLQQRIAQLMKLLKKYQ